MTPSFQIVQFATAVGPYSGSPTITLPNVAYGNCISVSFAAYRGGSPDYTYPTSITDSVGNTYKLKSQSSGFAQNSNDGNLQWIARDVIGGSSVVITINGFSPGGGGGVGDGPSLIACEVECPDFYMIFAAGITELTHYVYNSSDQGGLSTAYTMQFRGLAGNGPLGSGGCSNTGICAMTLIPVGVVQPIVSNAMTAVAFMNEFLDVFILMGNYNEYGPTTPYYTTSGTLIATTYEPHSGGSSNPGCSLGLAWQDFPYLNGPLQADCDNPPNGTVGVVYGLGGAGHYILADGGTPPYTWTLVGGLLPPGLSLDSGTGLISGTPTAAGKFLFSVLITDSGGQSEVVDCVIAICPAGGSGQGNYMFLSRC